MEEENPILKSVLSRSVSDACLFVRLILLLFCLVVQTPSFATVEDLIRPRDVIRVEIRAVTSATPDINGLFRVGEDGFIEMKLINRRLVNGLSTKQAENLIAKAFSKWLKRPQVSINIVLGASNRERIAHGKVANVFRDTLLGPSKDNLLVGLGSSDGLKVHSVVRLLHVGQQIVTAEVADLDSTYAICIVRDGNGKVRTSDDAQIETGYYRKKANP